MVASKETFPVDSILAVELGPLKLKNPVLAASGTFGYGEEYADLVPLQKLGGFITKGLSLEPRVGNKPPRLAETPCGLLNAIGLENIGLQNFLKQKLPFLRKAPCAVLVNIFGSKIQEYVELASRLTDAGGLSGLEINISCPNIEAGGVIFGTEPRVVYRVVSKIRRATPLFLMVKLSPNVTDIQKIAQAAEEAGADAISLINTLLGMAIDIQTRTPLLGNITGGLSGPAIKPIGVRMVWQVAKSVRIPVVGVGGIASAADALEYIIAGACAIQVGSAHFWDPSISLKILEGIKTYLQEQQIPNLKALVGSLQI